MRFRHIFSFATLLVVIMTAPYPASATTGGLSAGTNFTTVQTLAQLTADASFAGTVYLTAPVTLTAPLTLTCDLRPVKGAVITTAGYALALNGGFEAGNYQVFSGIGAVTFGSKATTVNPVWWGADPSGIADSTAAFASWGAAIQTSPYPEGNIPAGTYSVSVMPVMGTVGSTHYIPVKIRALGAVKLIDTGSGVFWSFQDAYTNSAGNQQASVVEGPIQIIPSATATPSIYVQIAGATKGSFSNIFVDGNGDIPNTVGFEIRDSITAGGTFGVTLHNCYATRVSTAFRAITYNGSVNNVNGNTFVDCYAAEMIRDGFKWRASHPYPLNTYIVPYTHTSGAMGFRFKATVAGTSSGTEPTWSSVAMGGTVVDGGVTWTRANGQTWAASTAYNVGDLVVPTDYPSYCTGANTDNVCSGSGAPLSFCTGSHTDNCCTGVGTGCGQPMAGQVFYASTAGTSSTTEPTWTTATKLGSTDICTASGVPFACCTGAKTGTCAGVTITDGTVTWTRVGWDNWYGSQSSPTFLVPSPGIGFLMSGAEGNTWSGGLSENDFNGGGYLMVFLSGNNNSFAPSADFSNVNGLWLENNMPDGGSFALHNVLINGANSVSVNPANVQGFTFLPSSNGTDQTFSNTPPGGIIDGLNGLSPTSANLVRYDKTGAFYLGATIVGSAGITTSRSGTSGTAVCSQTMQGTLKIATCYLNGYAQTGTAQTWTFPTPFSTYPTVIEGGSGGNTCGTYNPTANATTLTLPANAGMTAETCTVTIIGQ